MGRPARISAEDVVAAAVELADRDGFSAVSMRGVAGELGVQAMSLYGHVANKEALLTGLVDWVYGQLRLPEPTREWRPELSAYATSSRALFSRHVWAIDLVASQPSPGPSMLRHHDAVLGCLLAGRLSPSLARHAYVAVTSYVTGFVLAETSVAFDVSFDRELFSGVAVPASEYPHFVTVLEEARTLPYSFDEEFDAGLAIILDALEARAAHA